MDTQVCITKSNCCTLKLRQRCKSTLRACMLSHSSHKDSSLAGSSVHVGLQARILEWVASALLQGIFLTQGLNPWLLHFTCIGRRVLYH